ncbi:MAG: UDP-N-acetylmuramate:L-alanyl-gamma-D-glutamyl-meso-diaminopimelate ligase [Gammaproteobacteria bacterium]|nr:MAG: UDP-N-acetylmuramate:L-alanyl-gamma-D-glutamyl-meso-diaminopimelate ligase [Gammaproteobacteria bacterium]
MHLHILGICGTFMGSLAILAKQSGYKVSGCDANVYPPMSTQLASQGIELIEGFDPRQLDPAPDLVVVGNAMSRGNPCVEYMLSRGLRYTSGPQWLRDHVLQGRWVVAAAGTHGKTTTSSMVAWILEAVGLNPGYLIGGVPKNFSVSARLGEAPFFVVEADEYDSAFFDKRSKFVHYMPRTAILNNLEYDHADIFDDLAAIQKQFHHLVRTIPENGLVIAPRSEPAMDQVLNMGCWTPIERFAENDDGQNSGWSARLLKADGSEFDVILDGKKVGEVAWDMTGTHSVNNGLAAIAAARHCGVRAQDAAQALSAFEGVKRRMEVVAVENGVTVYDDFAHHPTAIATTLEGLRKQVGKARIIAVIEPRSNTMRMGVHKDRLAPSVTQADQVIWYQPPDVDWGMAAVADACEPESACFNQIELIVDTVKNTAQPGDHVVVMSNGGFGGIHNKLVNALKT